MMNKNYDFFLRIGVDGKRNVGKSCLINKFASDDFDNGQYKNAFHAYVTTTHIRLDDYDLKIEFLETGWNLRPNENYYKYIDGAILVYDISQSDGLKKIKELSREYSRNEIPIMIVANKCDLNEHKNRDDLLKEVKNYFGEELNILGEEVLFDKTSEKEKTSASLNKILKKCISRLLDFKGTNDLNKLTSPNSQFKSVMKHATQLYLYEVPKKVIGERQQIEEILHDGIKAFLSLVCTGD
ncbi:P-loop containing nucleoside triphosphate hydrolase protein [Gigaspora rosea]|uniref:P-loop containing nucleoside triphosphate hydrolase protein n=1 Tax=Gigaspora rosea TaxID=44941 RepID=A0A397UJ93_9GLOM|nr:P-loop containing nucleoside triphosphate hydrolase protein [Gigaspora rosea]